MDNFGAVIDQFIGQLINIPLINPLSFVYVILNLLLWLTATLFGSAPAEEQT